MSDTAFQIQYRQEFIKAFEQHSTLLRETTTTEAVIKGQQAVFLVAGSGGAYAVTRGVNGLIPARNDNNAQNTVTLQEWHDLVRKDGFNIFASQGNQRAIMQMTTMAVINRQIDFLIINALATGTVSIGAGAGTIPNVSLFENARVKLSNAFVQWDSNITMLCQPSFMAYLEQAPEFANALWVDIKPFQGEQNGSWRDKPGGYRWRNVLFVEHPNLPGKGTSSEYSYCYHKWAIGHAMDTSGVQSPVGYNEEQDYSWARCTVYMGALVLQNTGIVLINHDGSAYA